MPQNTTNTTLGVPLNYQNPPNISAVLDSESVGVDPTSGAQLTREFVVPEDSISGQTSTEVLIPILNKILAELRAIRLLTSAGTVPGNIDEIDDILDSDEVEAESEES